MNKKKKVRPFFVEIQLPPTISSTNQRVFVAGQSVEVKCRTSGSRPAPSITWWKGNKQIAPHLSTVMVSVKSAEHLVRLPLSSLEHVDEYFLSFVAHPLLHLIMHAVRVLGRPFG